MVAQETSHHALWPWTDKDTARRTINDFEAGSLGLVGAAPQVAFNFNCYQRTLKYASMILRKITITPVSHVCLLRADCMMSYVTSESEASCCVSDVMLIIHIHACCTEIARRHSLFETLLSRLTFELQHGLLFSRVMSMC